MKKLTTILTCGILLTALHQASAAAQLRLSDGTPGGTVTITDEGPGDSANGIPGVVEYSGPVGANWVVNVTVGTSKPVQGGASSPVMDVGTQNVSADAGTLTIDWSDTDFTSGGAADLAIGGTTSGNVTYKVFTDPGNTNFGLVTLVGSVGPFSGGAFNGDVAGTVPLISPYSMTLEAVIQHPGAGSTGFDAVVTVVPPTCDCSLTFNSPQRLTNCALDTIPDVTASQICNGVSNSVPVAVVGAVTNGGCPQIITRTNSATDACGTVHTFVQTITVNCRPDCTITTSVTSTTAGTTGLTAAVANAGPGATYAWVVLNGSITAGQGTPTLTFTAGTDTNNPISILVTVTSAAGCQSTCSASIRVAPKSAACTITGVTISNTSWNKFNIPSGTSPLVWVHAHLNGIKGIPTTGVTTVQFVGVSISLDGTSYALPDGVMTFDSSAPATITTTFSGGKWNTLVNPNNLSDEMFFTGAAISVTPAIAAGAKATLSYTTLSSVQGISFSWQWSAAVYTFWPADWNQAMIQPFHQSLHAGTPLNTTVQKSLIQGPRGGGGSNFTGSWSATGTAACQ